MSPQWYEDSKGRRISDEFKMVGNIDHNLAFAFVENSNNKYACGRFINGYFKTLTPFVFDDFNYYDSWNGEEDAICNVSYFGSFINTGKVGVCARVIYHDDDCLLSEDMKIYKRVINWLLTILQFIICVSLLFGVPLWFYFVREMSIWWSIGWFVAFVVGFTVLDQWDVREYKYKEVPY